MVSVREIVKKLNLERQDLEIYHNGTNSFIDNNTGSLYVRGVGDDL